MSEQISENSGFTERYNAFLAYYELTPKALADKLGDSGHVKYNNYKQGIGKPSADTLMDIAVKFPISIDWMLLGIGTMIRQDAVDAHVMEPKGEVGEVKKMATGLNSQDQLTRLSHMLDMANQQVAMLKAENQKVWRLALPKEVIDELNFLRSSSQITALQNSNEVYGLVRYPKNVSVENEGKVLPLNSVLMEAMRVLNSLAKITA